LTSPPAPLLKERGEVIMALETKDADEPVKPLSFKIEMPPEKSFCEISRVFSEWE